MYHFLIAISIIIFILTMAFFIIGGTVMTTFIGNRLLGYEWEQTDGVYIIIGPIFIVLGILGFIYHPDKDMRAELFMHMKPNCQEETIDCLQQKADWYKDSVEYEINVNKTDILDSLKAYVRQYEKENNGNRDK